MTRLGSDGRIEVICGCMYSGKTEELIRRLHHVQIARQRLQAFTPRRDTRYAVGNLVSHNGVRIEAQAIDSIREIPQYLLDDVQVVALDELHFFEDDPDTILALCQDLADRGLRVLVAGLDQDFRATPFPAGAYATRSQRMIDGQPAPYDAPTIVVGGLDMYEARCRKCFEAPQRSIAGQNETHAC